MWDECLPPTSTKQPHACFYLYSHTGVPAWSSLQKSSGLESMSTLPFIRPSVVSITALSYCNISLESIVWTAEAGGGVETSLASGSVWIYSLS